MPSQVISTELINLLAEREELEKRIVELAREEFGAMVAGLFESEPELENFGWYNTSREYDDEGNYPMELAVNVDVTEDFVRFHPYLNRNLRERVHEAWASIPEWVYLKLFDDGDEIIVYPDRVEIFED